MIKSLGEKTGTCRILQLVGMLKGSKTGYLKNVGVQLCSVP